MTYKNDSPNGAVSQNEVPDRQIEESQAQAKKPKSRIIRVPKDKEYFKVCNAVFNDSRLSWEARGVLGYILSKPDDWIVRNGDLEKQGPGGVKKMKRILKELKEAGYLRRYCFRKNPSERQEGEKSGQFEWVTEVYEKPSLNPDFSVVPKQGDGNSDFSVVPFRSDGNAYDGKGADIPTTDSRTTDKQITETSSSCGLDSEKPETANQSHGDGDEILSILVDKRGYGRNGVDSVIEAQPKQLAEVLRQVRLLDVHLSGGGSYPEGLKNPQGHVIKLLRKLGLEADMQSWPVRKQRANGGGIPALEAYSRYEKRANITTGETYWYDSETDQRFDENHPNWYDHLPGESMSDHYIRINGDNIKQKLETLKLPPSKRGKTSIGNGRRSGPIWKIPPASIPDV